MYSRGGGRHCSVRGCTYNDKKLYELCSRPCFDHYPRPRKDCPCDPPYRFYSPTNQDDRREWLFRLQLKKPPQNLYVCSFHFVDKQPSERNRLPRLPELMLGHERPVVKKTRRILVRSSAGEGVKRGKRQATTVPECDTPEKKFHDDEHQETEHRDDLPPTAPPADGDDVPSCAVQYSDAQTQWTDAVSADHGYATAGNFNFKLGVSTQTPPLPLAPTMRAIGIQCGIAEDNGVASFLIIQTNTDANLYTGIAKASFEVLVSCMTPFAHPSFKMVIADQILLTLMKLKLNLLLADIARRFNVSEGLVSKMVSYWIKVLSENLSKLVVWLPRETIRATMPSCFKVKYPKTTVILDCEETFIQKANNLESRGESYSLYKSHNTAKYLVAIAPSGYIMFISNAYGGRASDKYIVQDSGILEYLLPGDEVMADRGFTIQDWVFSKQAKLNIPAFSKGRQLSDEDVTTTRRLANVRIHVERAIRRLKVFRILKETVPVSLTTKLDSILRICAALVNLKGDLIQERERRHDE